MKKNFILYLLLIPFSIYSQSLRESILRADYIAVGYRDSKKINNDLDYNTFHDSIVVKEMIKGEYSAASITIDALIDDVNVCCIPGEEERKTFLFFINKAGDSHYLYFSAPYKLKKKVIEMVAIGKIKNPQERFSATVEWTIDILENVTPLGFVEYNDLRLHTAFFYYYRNKGVINGLDDILTFEQKQKVLKKLCSLKLWDQDECFFAHLIYKEFPSEVEQHILKMLNGYFKNARYTNLYNIKRMLDILIKGQKSKSIKALQEKLESRDYKNKEIRQVIEEIKEIFKSH